MIGLNFCLITCLRMEVQCAGTDSASYRYVALHGTGTPLGDPIEMGALGQALASSSGKDSPPNISIGSVKSCYGHSEGAAGLTGSLLAIKALTTQANMLIRIFLSEHLQSPLIFSHRSPRSQYNLVSTDPMMQLTNS